MKQKLVLLMLAVVAAVLVAGVGTGSAYNDGSCQMRAVTINNAPSWVRGFADAECNEVVPAIYITQCLFRSTLGPIISWSAVSCVSGKWLNVPYRNTNSYHICTNTSAHLYRVQSFTMISWPSGLGTSSTTTSGAIAANCG